MKLKKGDPIIVTAGKDKGRKGKIEKVVPKLNKVLVPGVNVYKKHVKPQGENKPGGIVDIAKPLPVSNVAFFCSKCKQPTRIGYRLPARRSSGKIGKLIKTRICRKCQATI